MERVIGTLPKLISSRSNPHASLVNSISRRYKCEMITTFGETYLADDWISATGQPRSTGIRADPFPNADDPDFFFLAPTWQPALLADAELDCMRAVLGSEGVSPVPFQIRGKKYFRVRLGNGAVAGSQSAGSDDPHRRRRSNFVRVQSTELSEGADGQVAPVGVLAYGLVHHYVAVFINGTPMAFAFIECIRSSKDRLGKRVIAARGSCRSKRTTRRRGLTRYSLANTPLVGTTLACTLLFGTTLTSTRLVGTTLAGTTLAGITLATTAHTGTALAGGTVSGTTPVDPTPTGTTSPGDTPPGCPVAGCSACSQPPRIRGWGRAKTGGAAEGVKDSWGPSASASPYQRARRLPIGWGEQNTKNSSCA
eukprot:contig_5760_g1303